MKEYDELVEENEQLKMKNDNLIKISAMIQVRNDKLSKENKELKEELVHLNQLYLKLKMKQLHYMKRGGLMTKKRFSHKKWYDDRQLFDGDEPFAIVDVYIQAEEICNKLNELHEEKEILEVQLKSATNEIDKLIAEINMLTDTCHDCCKEIRAENERLEKENKELKEILKHTYEVHECETCKHIEYFNWIDSATMEREYDSRCGKGLHYDDEVHGCEEYELDLEMFKKRVKR